MSTTPALEPEVRWLAGWRFYLVYLVLLLGFGGYAAWKHAQLRRGDPGALPTIALAGPSRVILGGTASYRALVRDARDARPIAGERVQLIWRGDEDAPVQLAEGRTNDRGEVILSATLPKAFPKFGGPELAAVLARDHDCYSRSIQLRSGNESESVISTDKPRYQPGQLIHIRSLSLARDGRPVAGRDALFQVVDPQNTLVMKRGLRTSEMGIAATDFQLADQVRLGTYVISVTIDGAVSRREVDVRRYSLPKLALKLELESPSASPGGRVKGGVRASWTFGKPVEKAGIEVGFASPAAPAKGTTGSDGAFHFDLAAPLSPGRHTLTAKLDAGGGLRVESAAELLVADPNLIQLEVHPESGALIPSLENRVYVITTGAGDKPLSADVVLGERSVRTDEHGLGVLEVVPGKDPVELVAKLGGAVATRQLQPNPERALLLRPVDEAPAPGSKLPLKLFSRPEDAGDTELEAFAGEELVATGTARRGETDASIELPKQAHGLLRIVASRYLPQGRLLRDERLVSVKGTGELAVRAELDRQTHAPGETARVTFSVTDAAGAPTQAALGLVAVDEAFYALMDARPDLEVQFFGQQRDLRALRERWVRHRYGYRYRGEEWLGLQAQNEALESDAALRRSVALSILGSRYLLRDEAARDYVPELISGGLSDARRRLIGGAFTLPLVFSLLAFLALALYGVRRFFRPHHHSGASEQAKREWLVATRSLITWWVVGVLATALISFTATWFVAEVVHGGRHKQYLTFAVSAGLPTLLFTLLWWRAVRAARRSEIGRALPGLAKVLGLVPLIGFFALLGGVCFILDYQNTLRLLFNHSYAWAVLAFIGVLMWQLTIVLLSLARQTAVRQVSLLGRIWLVSSRLVVVLVPLTVIGAWQFGKKHFRSEYDYFDYEQVESSADNKEGGTGTRAKGEEGSMGGPPGSKSAPREEERAEPRIRSRFPETLLWLPELLTDERGKASVEIPLADSITNYRLAASAVSKSGKLGSVTLPLAVFQDFFVDLALPPTLTQGDEIEVPITAYNYLDRTQSVKLVLEHEGFALGRGAKAEQTLELAPHEVRAVGVALRAEGAGRRTIRVKAQAGKLGDAVERSLEVVPRGVRVVQVQNGRLEGKTRLALSFPPNAVPGGTDLHLKVYGGLASQMSEGLDGVLRQPYGCFEQTSSTTYPNVLVLDFLRRAKASTPELEKKALGYIGVGYQRLVSFEVPGGGFDWFGRGPANTVLSAYGLLEFADMAKVFPVDPAMIARTREFLYSQQDADGSWKSPSHGVSSALQAGVSTRIADVRATAYIAQALAEAGDSDPRLEKALDVVQAANEANDVYSLSLRANALLAGKRRDAARPLVEALNRQAKHEGDLLNWSSDSMGLTYSHGPAMDVEVTALAALALERIGEQRLSYEAALSWIANQRNPNGGWWSTASTVAAMRALLAEARSVPASDQSVSILVNGKEAKTLRIAKGAREVHQLADLAALAKSGENVIELEASGAGDLSYQLVGTHYLPLAGPGSSKTPPALALGVSYSPATVDVGGEVRCKAQLDWHRTGTVSMVLAELGVPPGFEVEGDDLEALVRDKVIDRYETGTRGVTMYVPSLEASKRVEIQYRLRAVSPSAALAPASRAYPYYEPDAGMETKPVLVTARR